MRAQTRRAAGRKVLRDRSSGLARGTGFVRFARTEDAAAAVGEMNGRAVEGCPAPLEVPALLCPDQCGFDQLTQSIGTD